MLKQKEAAGDLHHSERLPHRDQRRKAKEALRRGAEPEPVYVTGRMWVD